jgi:cobalt-zinc-cadmium efflux system protein
VSQSVRLSWVLALNLALIVGLVIAGLAAGSLGVLATAADTAADASAMVLGLIAIHFRDRHGKVNAPTYVAGVNASLLLIVVISVVVEAVQRLIEGGHRVQGLPTLIASAAAMVVMLICAAILGRGAASEDLHMRSVLLDTLADALAAAGVAIVGAVILITGRFFWLDSVVAIIISSVIAVGALRLLGDVVTALRTGALLEITDDD